MDIALQIDDLCKTYKNGFQALDSLGFEVKKGEVFGLLGPNGAGKTTTINVMAGVVSKTSGHMEVFGVSIDEDHNKVKEMVGVVPQELVADRFFTVQQALVFQAGYYGVEDASDRINELLEALSLTDKRDVSTAALSGGMKRRLMVAKALVHDPELVVLDEPTAGVDIELRWELWEYVKKLHKRGKTIILTTHYLEEAEAMCDRIAIMDKGKVLALDSVAQLKRRFGTPQKKLVFTLQKGQFPQDIPFSVSLEEGRGEVMLAEDQLAEWFLFLQKHQIDVSDVLLESQGLDDVFHNVLQNG